MPSLIKSPAVPEQGQLTLGLDADREFYATLTPNRDPKAATAKGRIIIGLGLGPQRKLVVTSLHQESELIRKAMEGMPAETQRMISEIANRPREAATIFGVRFTAGASAEGEVIDTGIYDSRQVQAALAKVEAELAGTPLGRRAEALTIGGAEQRAEATKTLAAMDEIAALSDQLHASLDAADDDALLNETPDANGQSPVAQLIRQVQMLGLDMSRLDLASTDPADHGKPDVTTQRSVVRESVVTFRALLDATKTVIGTSRDREAGTPAPTKSGGK